MRINGHEISLGNILTVLGMTGALATVWGTLNADNADTKRRLTTLETRQTEDRHQVREDQKELKQDVKDTKEAVQKILIKMEAREQRERTDRGR